MYQEDERSGVAGTWNSLQHVWCGVGTVCSSPQYTGSASASVVRRGEGVDRVIHTALVLAKCDRNTCLDLPTLALLCPLYKCNLGREFHIL